jgi:hypothetical protein
MNIANIQFKPSSHRVRTAPGLNGGLSFTIKTSRQVKLPRRVVTQTLNKVAARLAQAPFADQIKGRALPVWLLSSADIRTLCLRVQTIQADSRNAAPGISNGSFPPAFYEPSLGTVIVNSIVFIAGPGSIELLIHELLHAYSTEVRQADSDPVIMKSGLMRVWGAGDRQIVSGQYLNEGLTEYLRVISGGPLPQGPYLTAYEAVCELAKLVGAQTLIDAYFKGDLSRLIRSLESLRGLGNFSRLMTLSDLAGTPHRSTTDCKNLLDFIRSLGGSAPDHRKSKV